MKWIRPAIISVLAIAVTVGFLISKVSADVFVPFATGLIIYWFKDRQDDKAKGQP